MNILNQFSYPILTIALIAAVYWLLRYKLQISRLRVFAVQGLILLIAVAGFVVLRPGDSDVDNIREAERLLNNGRPTMIEFFSNYCTACITLRPGVDNLVEAIDDDFNVLRVNIHTGFGRELREQMRFSFTPEFVLFNAEGEEVWRNHLPPSDEQLALASG